MSIAINILSAVLKSVVNNKIGNELANELIDISIDGFSEKSVNMISDYIDKEKSKIDYILSKDNMESLEIPEENVDYVVAEIKDLLSKVKISDEVFRQCKYNDGKLSDFLWDEYGAHKDGYIECESDIKKILYTVAKALIKLMRESEGFEKDFLIQISNSVDDTYADIQKISEYVKENLSRIDDNSQMVFSILCMILEAIQKKNDHRNVVNYINDKNKKIQNNKKNDYIKIWNSRLFLHRNNDERPITLKDAFIMPDYKMRKSISKIEFYANDALDEVIDKYAKYYDRTCTMLITGVPGIGKSSITSWIANRYKDDDRVIILRFRDWSKADLEKGLLVSICNTLNCDTKYLENKLLILDGYDEMKALSIRDRLLHAFHNDIKDFENFKCIITSRPAYIIDSKDFIYIIHLERFNIDKIDIFCRIITGKSLDNKEKIEANLDVLGIPVILYMAIMSNINISENPTKPELYNHIFAEEGGIFDRFCNEGMGYGTGAQILRNPENIKKYLDFLQKVAFMMFEKESLSIKTDDLKVPELEFQGDLVSILEFPIKHLFEDTENNIEFIHKSIYEYFVAEYIFHTINEVISTSKEKLAGTLGILFIKCELTEEILEFLKFKICSSKFKEMINKVYDAFELMLQHGMTCYINKRSECVISNEMRIFKNMLEIIHLYNEKCFSSHDLLCRYINYNTEFKLNLEALNLKEAQLEGANLSGTNLKFANLRGANLIRADLGLAILQETDLRGANLQGADLQGTKLIRTKLKGVDLRRANLRNARFVETDLRYVNLREADLHEVTFLGTIFTKKQVRTLENKCSLVNSNVFVPESNSIIRYEEYKNSGI